MSDQRVISADLVARLAAILGKERVRADAAARTVYASDATPLFRGTPDVVVFPSTAEEVAAILDVASKLGVPVVPRGAGTNLAACAVPHTGGIVLSLTRMNAILELDTANHVVRVQPGVTTEQLSTTIAGAGLFYPPDPGSRTTSTIGGNVATCAGGLRGLKYGVTRDYVVGLQAVLPTGEVIRCGGTLVKDVAGYDLTRLLCGSEGTLAVITEVTLRLVPAPRTSLVGAAYFSSLADAGNAVSAVLERGIVPATLEFLDKVCLVTVEAFANIGLDTSAGALLIFGQDGGTSETAEDMRLIAATCQEHGATRVHMADDHDGAAALLAARRAVLPSLSRLAPLTILEDASVPRSRLAEMVGRIAAIADRYGLTVGTFGHAGDGNLHPTCVIDPAEETAVERAHAAFAEIFAAALELGGTITGEHGVGLAKLPYLEARLGSAHVRLLRRIKQAFDPAGILNPGKLGS